MTHVVFVHGIDQQQLSADKLESTLVPALAGGLRNAGFPKIADRMWRHRTGPDGIELSVAFYGGLFLDRGAQGDDVGSLSNEGRRLMEALALELLTYVSNQSQDPSARAIADREMLNLQLGVEGRQGVHEIARSALMGLARIPWFAPYGMSFAQTFVNRALTQVTRYLLEEPVREFAISSVLELVTDRTAVVVGHSLGSVVAYEALHRLDRELPLFVTLGSPLGLPTIIYPRLRPQPPCFPRRVRSWLNVADRRDLVAASLDLSNLFGSRKPESSQMRHCYTVDNGSSPHSAEFYLGKPEVGEAIARVFAETA
jgi:hypothetical protein